MASFNIEDVLTLKSKGLSNRAIASVLGRESQESTIRYMLSKLEDPQITTVNISTVEGLSALTQEFVQKLAREHAGAKIFLGDVETSVTQGYFFGRFKQFISPKQVEVEPHMLTFAGKWLHSPTIYSRKLPDYDTFAVDIHDDREMIEDLWQILDECDIFIAHNARFDRGWANQRFAYHGMNPPSPYQVIDTLAGLKEAFSLPSNALEASCNYFELQSRKLTHEGISLWVRCFHGEVEAFEEMETYNIGDIPTLEELYLTVRPFMKRHPNVALYKQDSEELMCVRCASTDLTKEKDKVATTYLSKFNVYRCGCCGSVMRTRVNVRSKKAMFATLSNIM